MFHSVFGRENNQRIDVTWIRPSEQRDGGFQRRYTSLHQTQRRINDFVTLSFQDTHQPVQQTHTYTNTRETHTLKNQSPNSTSYEFFIALEHEKSIGTRYFLLMWRHRFICASCEDEHSVCQGVPDSVFFTFMSCSNK